MGAKESKPSCISEEEAIKRVSESEYRRIKDTFKKSTGPGVSYLSQNAFQQEILCESVPPIVADWLYTAFGGNSKGILFKDLFCALVLLTRGKEDEKIRFLWNFYCNDTGTYILKADYTKSLNLETNVHSTNSTPEYTNIRGLTNTSVVLSLFSLSDRVTFEQFKEWILNHKNATVLSKWILSNESCINLTSELETPTFYQSLAGVTHLEEQDIGDLEKEFWRLKNSSINGQLDLELLAPLISPPIPKAALQGLFSAFDENRDGHIDFKELCCGVSASCRGPNVERSKFCFKIFDFDRDGLLNFEELNQMVEILIFVAKESSNSNHYQTITKSNVLNDLIRFTRNNIISSESENELTEESKIILRQEDFMMWNVESSLNLVQPFLDLTFEVCHIVFGIRPQCKHMEFEIVNGWLRREERRGYKVGQFWYLISKNWWNIWTQYTHNYSSIQCVYCKNTTNNGNQKNSVSVDEAMVCDESFNSTESVGDLLTTGDSSSLGSGSSGVSCGRYLSIPGPIDNTNLITPNPFKSIRSLTGEGGHLKRDTPLVQGHDFELVPKSLWEALARWYGFILPLPRQVIQPPNAPDVELELYPLNLRILLHQNTPIPNVNQSMPSWSAVSGGYGALSSGGAFVTMSSVPNLQPPKRYLAYTAAFSRLATVKLIGEFLCENIKLKSEDIRLWHIMSSGMNPADDIPILLEEDNMTLKELLIKDKDQLLLEIRNKDLTWPEELGSLTQTSNINQDRRMTRASIHSMHVAGATGLHNLGNTCFMNAALQVLFNTSPLAQYFIKNIHLFELNVNNKLGTKGQLATRYGELIREVWTATTRSIAPLKLRFCVTKHAPQFAGGGQHDSQELLEWLLDALHEDLNRVTEKPYTELKDSNGRPDEIVAAEAWAQHHARNQSIVIDLFYGQLKSKVSCLCCGRESVRFDPFSLLSLPLPVENYIYFEILVIFLDGSIPTKYGLRLNFDSKYYDVKTKLANLCHFNPNLMLLCEISNSQIQLILHDDQKIKTLNATEIYAYQLPEGGDESRSRTSSILGVNIEKGLKDIQRSPALLIGTENIHINQIVMNQQNSSQQQQIENSVFTNTTLEDINIKGNQQNEINRRTSKQSEISTSPESTFVGKNRKRISTANLLSDNSQSSCNYSSDEASIDRNHQSNNKNDDDTDCIVEFKENITNSRLQEQKQQQQQKEACQCKTNNTDSCEDDDNNSINLTSNIRKDLYPPKMFVNCKIGKYLIAVHRKLTRQDTYFLSYHKTRPSLFGVPLLLPCYENGTNKDLYCAVWMQVSRLLSPLPPAADQSTQNHAADCDDSLGYDFPFTLRAVTHDGKTCALCPWSNFCRGCEIPCNDDYILQGALESSSANSSNTSTPKLANRFSSIPNLDNSRSSTPTDTTKLNISANNIFIAIDWDPTALHLRYQSTREKLWNDHETVAICRKEQTEPVDLNHCLRAFTSEEKLEQWYHCSHCKGKKPATKKLQIWRLPPILIIHLKRFNCVNNKWVKSHVNVNFPFDDFDPTPYLASVPQETILRHNDLKSNNLNKNMCNEDCENEIVEFDNDNDITTKLHKNLKINNIKKDNNEFSFKTEDNNTNLDNDDILAKDDQFYYDDNDHNGRNINKNLENSNPIARNVPNNTIERRKRLISTSLSRTPVVDGQFKDFHHHNLQLGSDPFDLKYKLYAVVSHSGMLNGGHYVSYACNPNGLWYCYNDSSCREIPKRPNIDPSSSYLLFYERKYLKYDPYLPNCEGRPIPNGNAIETDENENDLKKMCVIS